MTVQLKYVCVGCGKEHCYWEEQGYTHKCYQCKTENELVVVGNDIVVTADSGAETRYNQSNYNVVFTVDSASTEPMSKYHHIHQPKLYELFRVLGDMNQADCGFGEKQKRKLSEYEATKILEDGVYKAKEDTIICPCCGQRNFSDSENGLEHCHYCEHEFILIGNSIASETRYIDRYKRKHTVKYYKELNSVVLCYELCGRKTETYPIENYLLIDKPDIANLFAYMSLAVDSAQATKFNIMPCVSYRLLLGKKPVEYRFICIHCGFVNRVDYGIWCRETCSSCHETLNIKLEDVYERNIVTSYMPNGRVIEWVKKSNKIRFSYGLTHTERIEAKEDWEYSIVNANLEELFKELQAMDFDGNRHSMPKDEVLKLLEGKAIEATTDKELKYACVFCAHRNTFNERDAESAISCKNCAEHNSITFIDRYNMVAATSTFDSDTKRTIFKQDADTVFFVCDDANTQEIEDILLPDKSDTAALFEYMKGYNGVITRCCAINLLITGTTEPVKYVCASCGKITAISSLDNNHNYCHECGCRHTVNWEEYPNVIAQSYNNHKTHYNNEADELTCEYLFGGITECIDDYSFIENPNIAGLLKQLGHKRSGCDGRWVMPGGLAEHIIKQPNDTQEGPKEKTDLTSTLKFVCAKCGAINQIANNRVSTTSCRKCGEIVKIRARGGDIIECRVERLGAKNYTDPKEYIITIYSGSQDNLFIRIELYDEKELYISKNSAVYNNYTQIKNICIAEEFERLIRWQMEEAINDK